MCRRRIEKTYRKDVFTKKMCNLHVKCMKDAQENCISLLYIRDHPPQRI